MDSGGSALRTFLFLYGGFAHLLAVRIYADTNYPAPASRAFIDHPLTNGAIAVLGGAFVSWFIWPIVRRGPEAQQRDWATTLVSTVWRAIGATAVTLESFYVLASLFLALYYLITADVDPTAGFFGFFVGIQTYGAIALVQSIPFAVGYGLCLGAIIRLRPAKQG